MVTIIKPESNQCNNEKFENIFSCQICAIWQPLILQLPVKETAEQKLPNWPDIRVSIVGKISHYQLPILDFFTLRLQQGASSASAAKDLSFFARWPNPQVLTFPNAIYNFIFCLFLTLSLCDYSNDDRKRRWPISQGFVYVKTQPHVLDER